MSDLTEALVDECRSYSDTCLYTAVTFLIWLRWLRFIRTIFVSAPVVFGALATWKILAQTSTLWASVFTLLATVVPPLYRAMRVDKAIRDYVRVAGDFTNLRDRFRHAANVYSLQPFETFEVTVKPLIDRLDKARKEGLTPPEFAFRAAQKKINAGHYRHDHNGTGATSGA